MTYTISLTYKLFKMILRVRRYYVYIFVLRVFFSRLSSMKVQIHAHSQEKLDRYSDLFFSECSTILFFANAL
jgi:hypothetical protein